MTRSLRHFHQLVRKREREIIYCFQNEVHCILMDRRIAIHCRSPSDMFHHSNMDCSDMHHGSDNVCLCNLQGTRIEIHHCHSHSCLDSNKVAKHKNCLIITNVSREEGCMARLERVRTIFATLSSESWWTLATEATKPIRLTCSTVQTWIRCANIAFNRQSSSSHPTHILPLRFSHRGPLYPAGQMHW